MNNKINSEEIYAVDFEIKLSEDYSNIPSNNVLEKIMWYANKDRRGKWLWKFLLQNKDVDDYLENLVRKEPWMLNKKYAWQMAKRGVFEKVLCAVCGKQLTIKQIMRGKRWCCGKCAQKSDETRQLYKKVFFEKYGVENPMQLQGIKDKLKASIVEKYGVENVSQCDAIKKKREETFIANYGVKSSLSSPLVRDKIKQTCLRKYCSISPLGNNAIKQKIKETCLQKYSVDNVWKSESVKRKLQCTRLGNFYDKFASKWRDYVVPLFSKEEYIGMKKQEYKWRCVKCGCEFEAKWVGSANLFRSGSLFPLCPHCHPNHTTSVSNGEIELAQFVSSIYSGEIVRNSKSVIPPLELDVYLPQKKVAIEFDGLYWHSEQCGKSVDYHINKTLMCEQQGIQLIHIFEDEWLNKQEIVKDRIKSILGIYDKKIYARKCQIVELDAKSANKFLNCNHLQGSDNSSIRYGLYYESELVSVMSFGKPRFNKNYDWEMIRFCNKIGYKVIGGASKLLNCFRRTHNGSILSYSDRRYSNGRLYETLGFCLIAKTTPNYWYFKGNVRLSRYQCQKHKLKKLLGSNYSDNLSESENMLVSNWAKVYDCGNLVYYVQTSGN